MKKRCSHAASSLLTALCALSLLTAACSDDEHGSRNPDAMGAADAIDEPDAMLSSMAFAVAGNFSGTGVASTIEVPSLALTANAIAGVASDDPVVHHAGGIVYIINRFGHDNVTIVDPSGPTLINQISTGAGSNPQAVAIKGDTIYVAALGAAGVLVLDATDPSGGVQSTIDLSSLDSTDGIPDCQALHLVGDTLFVSCGILDSFVAQGPGKVAVIDTTDNTLTMTLNLSTDNPFSGFALAGDELLIATAPNFGDLTEGCVEAINTAGTPSATGCKIQHSATGGIVSAMSVDASGTVYLAVTEVFGTEGALLTYSGTTLSSASIVPSDQIPGDVVVCPTGEVIYADSAAGGYRVLNSSGTELTTAALDIGLPPTTRGITCF